MNKKDIIVLGAGALLAVGSFLIGRGVERVKNHKRLEHFGELVVDLSEETPNLLLNLGVSPEDIVKKKSISFHVIHKK